MNYRNRGICPPSVLISSASVSISPGRSAHPISTTTSSAASPPPMARLLAQTLTLARAAPSPTTASSASLRGLATKVEVIEIDLTEEDTGSSPGSPITSPSVEVVGIRRLEEAIHGVMVRRATPDWLPFVPGGSFWVPPLRRQHGVAELVGRIAAAGGADGVAGALGGVVEVVEVDAPMTEEEMLSLSTARGWPSASYFVHGKFPRSEKKYRKGATQTDDEES